MSDAIASLGTSSHLSVDKEFGVLEGHIIYIKSVSDCVYGFIHKQTAVKYSMSGLRVMTFKIIKPRINFPQMFRNRCYFITSIVSQNSSHKSN